jgi:formamidopyrimidine-DNA glycosylase
VPELPEVEIAARNIRAWAEGRRIVRVETDPRAARIFRPGNRAAFARALPARAWYAWTAAASTCSSRSWTDGAARSASGRTSA